jgi:hypothetical protein
MPSLSCWSAFCRSCFYTGRRSSSRFSRPEEEKDGARGRIENGGGYVARMAELQHRKHQEKSGRRKVEISGLHF